MRLEAQLAEAFAILDDMGVSKRGGRGSGREGLASIYDVHTHILKLFYPPGKCSTVPSLISICVSVLQSVEHSEKFAISSQFAFQSSINFEVFKMGFKRGMTVLLISISIFKLKCRNANRDPKLDC